MTRANILISVLATSALAALFAGPVQAAVNWALPLDRATDVNNIQFACTGVGGHERQEARWKDYSVKLETVGGYGQYLADEDITVKGRNGDPLLSVKCDAPWVLLRLKPGRYAATIVLPGAPPRQVDFTAPTGGQRDVIVRFPGAMAGRETRTTQDRM